MTESTAAKRPRKTPPADALLAAACNIVVAEGLAGLTLRPLAVALGVSVTVLGARADMMDAVCRAAAGHDALLLDQWRAMLDSLDTALPPAIAADLAVAILEDLATRQRAVSMLYLEILHACTWDDTLRAPFEAWAALRRAFWDGFGQRAGLAPALTACGWWNGYVIAELAYGMVLEAQPPYRMLRRLCLRRLFAGALASPGAAPDGALFALLGARMQPAGLPLQAGPARTSAWSARAARACGIRLAGQGVHGLTHRAVAAEIGVAHTTLSYHYPTQHDLLIAGLEYILAHILTAVDAASLSDLQRLREQDDGMKLDLARASFAVAMAATRMPELAPRTAAMRSRRGANLVKVFQKCLPEVTGIDALCAQVISMGLTGLTNAEAPGDGAERSVAAAFGAAAQWLKQNAYSA